ncbi:hypothetical protein Harman_23790 [Haloarcula mannanilytica]|uniref:Uncharacterized protein n=1 Tax=Haloarcula mannanilytica TaxID=2509225 RepID=A0A4C2EIX3_9EURY|nr:DUF362 domain-containing protein [Haloarcula mannanilytica]GCF14444.1 hypothetical protein Harman_23790 [Haloarcula mannanilytica]
MSKIPLSVPDPERLAAANDAVREDLPRFAPAAVEWETESIADVTAAGRAAVDDLPALDSLQRGAEIAITAGSRGIHDFPPMISGVIEALQDSGYEPFVFPSMGSHGGATADGQQAVLADLGMTPDSLGCPVRSSMATVEVGQDEERTVYVDAHAANADAILIANRVKPHTDFTDTIESGLCKMAVIGMGKHNGAEMMHNAGLRGDMGKEIRERATILFDELPIVGGIALVENAHDRATHVEGIPTERILERESELLERAYQELPMLPVEDLDLLIVDEMGKEVSGTGLDTNVIGRTYFEGEREPDRPKYTRIYVRSLTPPSHGNGLGIGLADMVHSDLVGDLDLGDTYVNIATSGETKRAKIPLIVPDDESALLLAPSITGTPDPGELRIARIPNTMEPGRLFVSEPVADELEDHESVTVGELRELELDDGTLPSDPYGT